MSNFSSIQLASEQLSYALTDYKRQLSQDVLSLTSFLSTVEAQLVSLQARIASSPETVTEDSLDSVLAGVQDAARAVEQLKNPSTFTAEAVAVT